MSTKYKHGDTVPNNVLCERIDELVKVITHGRSNLMNEFCMRVPAELDHDADLVMSEVARRLRKAEAAIAPATGNCLCGRGEWCEICDSSSQYNRLRKQLSDAINGPETKTTLEGYGKSITISADELCS